jgi:type VI secretion system protein ImpK
MSNGHGRRRPPDGGRRKDRDGSYGDDLDRDDDADFEDEEIEERPARRRAAPARRPAPGARGGGLFGGASKGSAARRGAGGSRPARGGGGFDWSAAGDDDADEASYDEDRGTDDWEDDDRPRRRPSPSKPRRRLTLMDLCTPVFGYAAILPRDQGGIHPSYQQFRQEVTAALDRVEREAPDHGIEREDAREACYALSLFLDEQVADSEWSGKSQWSGEPLSIVRLNDPEGGIHFFDRLEALGNRQRGVKKVILVCLALGFRGKFGELDPAQQGPRLGEVRQKLVRTIQEPLENRPVLFPDGYASAIPIEIDAATAPGWWKFAALGSTAVLVMLWLVLFWVAGRKPEPAIERLKDVVQDSCDAARPVREAVEP